jgi:uncharacterized membrane protein
LLRAHIGWWGVAGEVALPVKMIKGQPLWNEGDVGGYGLCGSLGSASSCIMIMMVMLMCFIVVLVIDMYGIHSGIFLIIVFR